MKDGPANKFCRLRNICQYIPIMGKTKKLRIFLLFSGVLALAAAATFISCATGPRALRLDDGLIVFVGEDGNIHVADLWGADRLLTGDAGESDTGTRAYAFPVWAPAGRDLAFVGLHRGKDGNSESTIAAYDYAGSLKSPMFSSRDEVPFYLSWSPGGDRIGFLTSTAGSRELNFRIAGLDGESRVAGTGSPFYWSWSPDGRAVVTHEGEPASRRGSRLRVLDPAGGSGEYDLPVKAAPFQTPAYSPDGRFFAVAAAGPGGARSLMISRRDGGLRISSPSLPSSRRHPFSTRSFLFTISTRNRPGSGLRTVRTWF